VDMQHSDHSGICVAKPDKRIDFSSAEAFQQALQGLLTSSERGLVVDAKEVEYVSSAGLRAFLLVARAASTAGKGFAVCALQTAVKEVFEVSGFSKIITLTDDLKTALDDI